MGISVRSLNGWRGWTSRRGPAGEGAVTGGRRGEAESRAGGGTEGSRARGSARGNASGRRQAATEFVQEQIGPGWAGDAVLRASLQLLGRSRSDCFQMGFDDFNIPKAWFAPNQNAVDIRSLWTKGASILSDPADPACLGLELHSLTDFEQTSFRHRNPSSKRSPRGTSREAQYLIIQRAVKLRRKPIAGIFPSSNCCECERATNGRICQRVRGVVSPLV